MQRKKQTQRRPADQAGSQTVIDRRNYLGNIRPAILLIALLVTVLIAYSNAMFGPFLYDDRFSIVANPTIRSIWPLSESLWGPKDAPSAGRPLVNLSFAFDYAIGKLDVFSYHRTNLILHCVNATIFLVWLYRTLVRSTWCDRWQVSALSLSFSIAALWALHPLQTETVSYITQRTELLMAMFFFATLYAARRAWDSEHRATRTAWQFVSIACCACGMGSKEVMVVAPIIVLLYDLTVLNQPLAKLAKTRWPLYFGLVATWGLLAWLLSSNPRGMSVGLGLSITPLDYLTTQFWAITQYLRLALWPSELCGDYGILKVTKFSTWFPCLVLLVVLAGLTILAWFRARALAFLGCWFFLILAPTSSFVPIVTEPVAERRMYLPLAAIIVLGGVVALEIICWLRARPHPPLQANFPPGMMRPSRFSRVARPESSMGVAESQGDSPRPSRTQGVPPNHGIDPKARRPLMGLGITVALITLSACVTYARNEVYRSERDFWTDVALKRPDNSRAFSSLGCIFMVENQLELAKASFEKAIKIDPSNADAEYNLGKWYSDQGDIAEAMTHYRRVIALKAFHADAYSNLGKCYADQGLVNDAMDHYERALAINPRMPETHFNRGLLLAGQGRLREAVSSYQAAINVEPSLSIAFYNLAHCYSMLGQSKEAESAYLSCVSLQPNHAPAWFQLGQLYGKSGRVFEAKRCFEEALRIQPNAIEARTALQELQPNE